MAKKKSKKRGSEPVKGKVGTHAVDTPGRILGLMYHCYAVLKASKANVSALRRLRRTFEAAKVTVIYKHDLVKRLKRAALMGATPDQLVDVIQTFKREAVREDYGDDETLFWTEDEDTGPGGYEGWAWKTTIRLELDKDESQAVLDGFDKCSAEAEKGEPDPKISLPSSDAEDIEAMMDLCNYWKESDPDVKRKPDILVPWQSRNAALVKTYAEQDEARATLAEDHATDAQADSPAGATADTIESAQ